MANSRPKTLLKRPKLLITAVVAACFGFSLGATEWAQADATPTAPALSINTNTAPPTGAGCPPGLYPHH
ncbi:hypothetical protein [Acidithiobacillus sulfurivorans]|uniref:hypothetical protein n=1 Tax=Acidithiobacillus sulfurivorans TaxID=1958756 RepID=UPI001D01E868|nr:hypothetical protein [Acidithiobacillus sulfurivorans]